MIWKPFKKWIIRWLDRVSGFEGQPRDINIPALHGFRLKSRWEQLFTKRNDSNQGEEQIMSNKLAADTTPAEIPSDDTREQLPAQHTDDTVNYDEAPPEDVVADTIALPPADALNPENFGDTERVVNWLYDIDRALGHLNTDTLPPEYTFPILDAALCLADVVIEENETPRELFPLPSKSTATVDTSSLEAQIAAQSDQLSSMKVLLQKILTTTSPDFESGIHQKMSRVIELQREIITAILTLKIDPNVRRQIGETLMSLPGWNELESLQKELSAQTEVTRHE